MEKPWKKYIPGLCGALGALLLAGMVRVCFGLERGGTADHAAVAAVLLVLAALALLLLRLEGYAAGSAAACGSGHAGAGDVHGLRRFGLQ